MNLIDIFQITYLANYMAKLYICKFFYYNPLFIYENKLAEALVKESNTFISIFIVFCVITPALV